MKLKCISAAVLIIAFVLSGYCQAAGIDDVLNKAKKEGKVVMLELGSVGCIPCEQMKPVMQKLTDNYRGKLEVFFVDVRRDGQTGRRFGVYVIPTEVFLDQSGKEFHRHIGHYAYEEIVPVMKKAGIQKVLMGKDLICYCFGYSEEDIIRDVIENNGISSILERIMSEKKKGTCRCSTTHPLGR